MSIDIQRLTASSLLRWKDAITPLGALAAVEFGKKWDPDCFFGQWWETLATNNGFFFVAIRDGELVGVLTGKIWVDDMSGESVAAKTHWFVDPKARGTSAGIRLWRAFEDTTKEFAQVMTSCPLELEEGQSPFYQKRGFKKGSRVFSK